MELLNKGHYNISIRPSEGRTTCHSIPTVLTHCQPLREDNLPTKLVPKVHNALSSYTALEGRGRGRGRPGDEANTAHEGTELFEFLTL